MDAVIIWRNSRTFGEQDIERTLWAWNAPVLSEELESEAKSKTPEGFYLHKIITPVRTMVFTKDGSKTEITNIKS